ncbi:MAG: hypothetical protein R2880_12030 [Deinococcales bacterium]
MLDRLNRARSEAQRVSQSQEISWSGTQISQFTITNLVNGQSQQTPLPYQAYFEVLQGPSDRFSYLAPFGRRVGEGSEWLLHAPVGAWQKYVFMG